MFWWCHRSILMFVCFIFLSNRSYCRKTDIIYFILFVVRKHCGLSSWSNISPTTTFSRKMWIVVVENAMSQTKCNCLVMGGGCWQIEPLWHTSTAPKWNPANYVLNRWCNCATFRPFLANPIFTVFNCPRDSETNLRIGAWRIPGLKVFWHDDWILCEISHHVVTFKREK